MYEHQAMLPVPDLLRAHGINVIELDESADLYNGTYNWKTNKQGYYFVDENDRHYGYQGKPNGWIWHHTASSGYTPNIRNSKAQTKAMLWMGLLRGNRLYQEGGGIPTVVFASAGPANYGNGAGYRPVLDDYVAKGERYYGPTRATDTSGFYGNRYYGCTEIVHRGDGSPLDQGVFRMAYITMSVLSAHFGWSPWQHIGHLDHTRRKIDPRFEQGSPYTIGFMQDVAQGYSSGIVTPPAGGLPPVDQNCPWTNTTDRTEPWYDGKKRPQCDRHYDLDEPLEWLVNSGMCNVPSQQEPGMKRAADDGIWYPSDAGRDMYDDPMVYGRTIALIERAT